jgi:non-ribosomal peptide synthetase component F
LTKLAGVPERLRLPCDFRPEDERDFRGSSSTHRLDGETSRGLRDLAKHHGTTTSTVVLALFKLFLFQLTKQDDFCVGVSIANRSRLELEKLIGFFVNILPIRTRFSDDMEFEALLEQVARNTREAFEHQDYPFDVLVEKINPRRESNRQPLLNVIYGFQNFEDIEPGKRVIGGASAADLPPPDRSGDWAAAFECSFETSKFDLTLFVAESSANLIFSLEFDTGLFMRETILGYLRTLDRFARMIVHHSTVTGGVS